ncbi:MAG: hypothetical protein ACYC0C_08700 [Devosia sp.]
MWCLEGACIEGGDAKAAAILGEVVVSGHLPFRQDCEKPFGAVEADHLHVPALDEVDQPASRIDADTGLTEALEGPVEEMDIAARRTYRISGELPRFVGRDIDAEQVGVVVAAIPDHDQSCVVGKKARRGEIEELEILTGHADDQFGIMHDHPQIQNRRRDVAIARDVGAKSVKL